MADFLVISADALADSEEGRLFYLQAFRQPNGGAMAGFLPIFLPTPKARR
jgi:hypothetical protein